MILFWKQFGKRSGVKRRERENREKEKERWRSSKFIYSNSLILQMMMSLIYSRQDQVPSLRAVKWKGQTWTSYRKKCSVLCEGVMESRPVSLGSLRASLGSEGASQKWHFSWDLKDRKEWSRGRSTTTLDLKKKKKSGVLNKYLNITENTKQEYYGKWRKEDKSTRKLEAQTTTQQWVSL